jgi:hypothetical protein
LTEHKSKHEPQSRKDRLSRETLSRVEGEKKTRSWLPVEKVSTGSEWGNHQVLGKAEKRDKCRGRSQSLETLKHASREKTLSHEGAETQRRPFLTFLLRFLRYLLTSCSILFF